MENNNYYVYILECSDGSYYTGYTNDIGKRIEKHQEGKGAKYTRGRTPVTLKYQHSFQTKSEAMKEEYRLKRLSRKQKDQIIKGESPRD